MLIPSIDLCGGRAVQLRHGSEHILTSLRDPVALAKGFNRFGPVAVIDLDAARGTGDNRELIRRICRVANTRVGGGIRDVRTAREFLRAGAEQIIIGTAAEPEFLSMLPRNRIIVALDHRAGVVVDQAWEHMTGESILGRAQRLVPYCAGFLCTFVESEGTMSGMVDTAVTKLRDSVGLPLTIAGGVSATDEAIRLLKLGVDVQVGMGLYTNSIDPVEVFVRSLSFSDSTFIPTIVESESGQVLMLAYSTPDSLRIALTEGQGVYFSRSRNAVWRKGEASGNTQELIKCRPDCDSDSILMTVRQHGPACHKSEYSCFGPLRPDLSQLFDTLRERKASLPDTSYSAQFFRGRTHLKRKILEEAHEVTLAETRDEAIWEIADLMYFCSILAVDEGIEWFDILAELSGRQR